MANELQGNLSNYQLQLQQVDAALTVDPENEDLIKLKTDLQEVLNLTLDLIKNQGAETSEAGTSETTAVAEPAPVAQKSEPHKWKPGDRCTAVWTEDEKPYEATLEEILVDGTCTVTFDGYGNTEVMQLKNLQPAPDSDGTVKKRGPSKGHGHGSKMSKKDLIAQQREYKKKKSQKKAQRRKEMEEEREMDKCKWQAFNNKLTNKIGKGRVKKSIFASPEEVSGKVGVGTCGVGGRPMTSYHQNEKWKKGAM